MQETLENPSTSAEITGASVETKIQQPSFEAENLDLKQLNIGEGLPDEVYDALPERDGTLDADLAEFNRQYTQPESEVILPTIESQAEPETEIVTEAIQTAEEPSVLEKLSPLEKPQEQFIPTRKMVHEVGFDPHGTIENRIATEPETPEKIVLEENTAELTALEDDLIAKHEVFLDDQTEAVGVVESEIDGMVGLAEIEVHDEPEVALETETHIVESPEIAQQETAKIEVHEEEQVELHIEAKLEKVGISLEKLAPENQTALKTEVARMLKIEDPKPEQAVAVEVAEQQVEKPEPTIEQQEQWNISAKVESNATPGEQFTQHTQEFARLLVAYIKAGEGRLENHKDDDSGAEFMYSGDTDHPKALEVALQEQYTKMKIAEILVKNQGDLPAFRNEVKTEIGTEFAICEVEIHGIEVDGTNKAWQEGQFDEQEGEIRPGTEMTMETVRGTDGKPELRITISQPNVDGEYYDNTGEVLNRTLQNRTESEVEIALS